MNASQFNIADTDSDKFKTFETLPHSYLILGPDMRILTASNVFLEAAATTREKLQGRFYFDAFPNNPFYPEVDAASFVRASMKHALSTSMVHQMSLQRYDVPSGDSPTGFLRRDWLISHTPVLDAAGSVEYIIQSAEDVTDKVSAERQSKFADLEDVTIIRKVENQRLVLEKLLLQAPALIAVFNGPQLNYEFVNPLYTRLFPDRELLGKPLLEALPELEGHELMKGLKYVYETGNSVYGEEMLIPIAKTKGGLLEDHYFNFIQQARLNPKGNIDGILSFAFDVTELVVSKRNLEHNGAELQQRNQLLENKVTERSQEMQKARFEADQQRLRLQQFFMQAPAGICILEGPHLIFELVNPRYQALFPGKDLLGRAVAEVFPEVVGQPVWDVLNEVYRSGQIFEGKDMLLKLARKANGPFEDMYYNFIYQPRFNTADQVDGIFVFALEVTTQVLARQKMEQNELSLQELSKALSHANLDLQTALQEQQVLVANKDEFMSIASHELKTPITIVKGSLQVAEHMLSGKAEINSVLTLVKNSSRQVEKLIRLIDDLLDITKIQSSKLTLRTTTFPVSDLVKECDTWIRYDSRGHTLETHGDETMLVNADKNRLEQVFNNLISNAQKYSSRGSRIILSWKREGHQFCFSVQDFGIGIHAETLPFIFDRFFRAEKTSQNYSGLGLGLFISHSIIKQHGGELRVKSVPGEGSTFTILLPA